MALPSSPHAYPDCFDFLEKCIDDAVGARKPFKSREECYEFRQRCYYFRSLTQRQNKGIYPPDDRRHGTSDYDELRLTITEGSDEWWWVYGKKMSIAVGDVESLSEVEGTIDGNEAST